MSTIKAERYDKLTYRLKRDGVLVGNAVLMTSKTHGLFWAMFDVNHKRIGRDRFEHPRDVAKALCALMGGGAA